jgi:hypothetical protein
MIGSIRSDAFVGIAGRTAGLAPQAPVSEVAPVRPVAPRQSQPDAETDERQLMQYLGNITRADASAVIALTQAPRQDATASFRTVTSAYGEV